MLQCSSITLITLVSDSYRTIFFVFICERIKNFCIILSSRDFKFNDDIAHHRGKHLCIHSFHWEEKIFHKIENINLIIVWQVLQRETVSNVKTSGMLNMNITGRLVVFISVSSKLKAQNNPQNLVDGTWNFTNADLNFMPAKQLSCKLMSNREKECNY